MRSAIVFASLLALPAAAQTVVPATITISAEARVERAPDLAEMSAGVVTQASTASQASRDNAARMTAVIAALGRAGVRGADVQTTGLSLQPQYDYQDRRAPTLTGYQATNVVTVRLRDLTRAGTTIDTLVAAGANQVNGPTFVVEDTDAALDAARTAATAKARARADLYARALGTRVRRVVQLTEGGGERPPMPLARMMASDAMAESTPIAPGRVQLAVTVTITAELE